MVRPRWRTLELPQPSHPDWIPSAPVFDARENRIRRAKEIAFFELFPMSCRSHHLGTPAQESPTESGIHGFPYPGEPLLECQSQLLVK